MERERERISTRARVKAQQSVAARLTRVRQRIWPAFQIGLAAGLAYWIAHVVVGHEQPFFAPIAVVLIVGFSGGERVNRAIDVSLGCIFGVFLGDIFFAPLGAGGWQIAVAVSISLLFASFFTKSELAAAQCAIGSVLIATILPPEASANGSTRAIDAFVGSVVGLCVLALVPTAPLTAARKEIAGVLKVLSSVLFDVSSSLDRAQHAGGSSTKAHRDATAVALETIRGTQSGIDSIASATKFGRESASLSPFFWRVRGEVTSLSKVIGPTDNAVRSTRVLVRRALVLAEDDDHVSDKQLEILNELAAITLDIAAVFDAPVRRFPRYARDSDSRFGVRRTPSPFKSARADKMPDIIERLRYLAAETGLEVLGLAPPGAGEKASISGARPALSAAVILAQSRSLIVDLLQICGLSREEAIATLEPTSEHPGFEPDVRRA